MINKKLFKTAVIITASPFLFTGCGDKAEPVSAEPTETVSEVDTEESEESSENLESSEPTPSPTVEPTEEPVEESPEQEGSEEIAQEEIEPGLGYEIIPIDEVVMYATTNANLRSGPGTDYEIVGSLSYAQEITVDGKVERDGKVWYVLQSDTKEKQMVSSGLVSTTKPSASTGNTGSITQQPSSSSGQQPPADDGDLGGGALSGLGLPEVGQDGANGRFENFEIE